MLLQSAESLGKPWAVARNKSIAVINDIITSAIVSVVDGIRARFGWAVVARRVRHVSCFEGLRALVGVAPLTIAANKTHVISRWLTARLHNAI